MTNIVQSDAIASDFEHMAINSTTICEGGYKHVWL